MSGMGEPMAKISTQRSDAFEDIEEIERRSSPRADLVVRVDYQTTDALFSEFARDINEGGLFVETDTPPPAGTSVELEFKLPGADQLIEVLGRVVRTVEGDSGETNGMGIEFDDLNAEVRQQINGIVRKLRA